MGLVSGLIAASTALSAVGSVASGIGARRYANALERDGERLAQDAIARGEEDVRRYGFDLSSILGAQRAGFGAQGIDMTQGSAAQITAQTEAFGAEDMAMIRENAMREAYGLRRNAQNNANSLRSQATGAFLGAAGTLLEGGANAWDIYRRGPGTTSARTNARRAMPERQRAGGMSLPSGAV